MPRFDTDPNHRSAFPIPPSDHRPVHIQSGLPSPRDHAAPTHDIASALMPESSSQHMHLGLNEAMAPEPSPQGPSDHSAETPETVRVKKTRGKQKIPMEYIEQKSRRQVSFYKRKTGLIKKVQEFNILTGAEVMLLMASETGHIYTFASSKFEPMVSEEKYQQHIHDCLGSSSTDSAQTHVNLSSQSSSAGKKHEKSQAAYLESVLELHGQSTQSRSPYPSMTKPEMCSEDTRVQYSLPPLFSRPDSQMGPEHLSGPYREVGKIPPHSGMRMSSQTDYMMPHEYHMPHNRDQNYQ